MLGGEEELRMGIATEVMAEHAEGGHRVAEASRDVFGALIFYEEGTQGLVLALFGRGGLKEEAADSSYVF
jgi:hypothetical protein